tara:strand:- start:1401 stop:1808 length:408 start_codon:yes stop_codon:yes gene_type:complete
MFVFVRLENIETKQAGARVRTVKTIPQAVAVFFEAVIFLALAPVSKLPGRHKLSLSIVFNIVLALGAQTIFGAQNLLPEARAIQHQTLGLRAPAVLFLQFPFQISFRGSAHGHIRIPNSTFQLTQSNCSIQQPRI